MTLRLPAILRNATALLGLACICAYFRGAEGMTLGVFASGVLSILNFALWAKVGGLLLSPTDADRKLAVMLWGAKLVFFFGGVVLLLSAFPGAAVTVGALVILLAILFEALASPQRLIAVEEA